MTTSTKKQTKLVTTWRASVAVDGITKVSFARASLKACLEEGIQNMIYYKALYPPLVVAICGIEEVCDVCNNTGERWKAKTFGGTFVKCPCCKGKFPTGKLEDIDLVMPEATNGIKLTIGQ